MASEEAVPTVPARARDFSRLFVAAMLATWIVGALPFPWRLAQIGTSAIALWFVAVALWATRTGTRVMALRVVLFIGAFFAATSLASGVVSLVFVRELSDLSRCEQRAITHQARDACDDQFWKTLEERYGVKRP